MFFCQVYPPEARNSFGATRKYVQAANWAANVIVIEEIRGRFTLITCDLI